MVLTIEISTNKGAPPKAHTVDSDDMPLILLEALQTGQAKEMREGIKEFLGLSDLEARALTVRHVKAIGEALKEASESPNGK